MTCPQVVSGLTETGRRAGRQQPWRVGSFRRA